MGSAILAIMGSTRNSKAALMNMETVKTTSRIELPEPLC
jgi:hypothetical protein